MEAECLLQDYKKDIFTNILYSQDIKIDNEMVKEEIKKIHKRKKIVEFIKENTRHQKKAIMCDLSICLLQSFTIQFLTLCNFRMKVEEYDKNKTDYKEYFQKEYKRAMDIVKQEEEKIQFKFEQLGEIIKS